MIKQLHVANINFEFELADSTMTPYQKSLEQHPLLLQLQFLPLLYAESQDAIAVTNLPERQYSTDLLSRGLWKSDSLPIFVDMNSEKLLRCEQLISWGNSRQISAWAKSHGIAYEIPPWNVIRKVNSKAFSFEISTKLPNAQLILTREELEKWLEKMPGDTVLKSSFGFSGKGNLIVKKGQIVPWKHIQSFCEKEWNCQRPIIAEPWMDRVMDFSTQWKIEQGGKITLLGSTRIKNDSRGSYQSTFSGPEHLLFSHEIVPFLEQHKIAAEIALQRIQKEGFFGNIGIDAMIYRNPKEPHESCLHPIVEINARQTMSFAALQFQRKWHPQKIISLSYTKKQENRVGLLPEKLKKMDQSEVIFSRQLYIIID